MATVHDEQLKIMRDKGIFVDLTPTFLTGLWSREFTRPSTSPALLAAKVQPATDFALAPGSGSRSAHH